MCPADKARRLRIPGVFEEGATPSGGMQRRPNAAGLAPRAARLHADIFVEHATSEGRLTPRAHCARIRQVIASDRIPQTYFNQAAVVAAHVASYELIA